MEEKMVVKISDNIVSPLGLTSEENYSAVKAGQSRLSRYEGKWNLPEPFVASLIDREKIQVDGHYTFFEQIVIKSASAAIAEAGIDPASPRVIFVLSTTKGNVYLLDNGITDFPDERVLLGVTADVVARHFGNPNKPVVVSNACISGVCAQIVAMRLLERGAYDYAVVVGADMQSPFIVSGFQSFKALSPEQCKPFDASRRGLNLGEAVATMVLGTKETDGCWKLVRGAIRNDANHISGPSRVGEGSYRALKYVLGDCPADEIAFVNAHGTATMYNDEMESIAVERAGLLDVPVNSLKGYFGHTMGAAGVLESILSMHAIDDNTILPTRGFENLGVTHNVKVSNTIGHTEKKSFIKLLSGFGGCNAALLFRKEEQK